MPAPSRSGTEALRYRSRARSRRAWPRWRRKIVEAILSLDAGRHDGIGPILTTLHVTSPQALRARLPLASPRHGVERLVPILAESNNVVGGVSHASAPSDGALWRPSPFALRFRDRSYDGGDRVRPHTRAHWPEPRPRRHQFCGPPRKSWRSPARASRIVQASSLARATSAACTSHSASLGKLAPLVRRTTPSGQRIATTASLFGLQTIETG
jgi:hypothetical protein